MRDTSQTSPSGDDIVDAARGASGNLTYKLYGSGAETPAGQPKDHQYIADTLDKAGLGFGDDASSRPAIEHWADPSAKIPGWSMVTDGSVQPGDVLATAKPVPLSSYHGGGQQLGIATGAGTTLGIVDNDRIGESDFGLKDGHSPTVRRSDLVSNCAATVGGDDNSAQPDPSAAGLESQKKTVDAFRKKGDDCGDRHGDGTFACYDRGKGYKTVVYPDGRVSTREYK